jgi:hypothetical protein
MPLSEAGIVRYMLDHGLVRRSDVVDGDFVAIPASRRHRSFRIRCGDGLGLFVKQAGPHGLMGTMGIAREAAFYWLAATTPPFTTLAPILPGYLYHDPARAMLGLEAARGVAPRLRQSLDIGFPTAIAEAVGAALATVHRIVRAEAGPEGAALIPEEEPWVLGILQPGARKGLPRNSGTDFALDVIARHPGFAQSLARLRADWRPERLVHADMKWDNCLVEAPEDGPAAAVCVVDWEMVAWGDPAWDAGSLIQDYLSQSILASPLPPQAPPHVVAAAAEAAMAAIRPAVAAFWRRYAAEATGPDFLIRSVAHGGARILQTCVEALSVAGVMTPNLAALLQLSHEMLERPDAIATSFLGFR